MKRRAGEKYRWAVYIIRQNYNDETANAEILEIFENESHAINFLRGHDEVSIIGIDLLTGEPFQ